MNRKEFIKAGCSFCGLAIAGGGASLLIDSCTKPANAAPQGPTVNFNISLTAYPALTKTGGQAALNGVVVAHTGSGYIAVAQACTHAGCSVNYSYSNNQFICPCHGGTFDTTGAVVSGPPPAPLKKYAVTQTGNSLSISG